jgi:flavin-dependent dehydrogenase
MAATGHPEVVVAGAGPAGASIARLLALRGKRVTVVDPAFRGTDRLEILSPSAMPVLQALGLVPLVRDPDIARQCLGIRRCWSSAAVETDDFLRHRGGLGFVIDRASFDARLRHMAADVGVDFVNGRIAAAARDGDEVVLRVADAKATFFIRAETAVDATGRPAALARRLGARRLLSERLVACRRRSGRLQGLDRGPTWLDLEAMHDSWSYQLAGPNGRQEAWTVHRGSARSLARTGRCVDASSARLSHAACDRWIAIGDAAAAFDPITSQGLINALATAIVAAGAILSPRGLDREASRIYSDAVASTFDASEVGRTAVYRSLRMRAA